MRKVNMPPIKFSLWTKWEDRLSISDTHYPGIYMLAITTINLIGKKSKYEDACYIGMTNSQGGLKSRWSQFNYAIHGKKSHSGGRTLFADLGHYEAWNRQLYVCGMPVVCNTRNPDENDLIVMGQVAYLEYEAFSMFYVDHPTLDKPKYNKK